MAEIVSNGSTAAERSGHGSRRKVRFGVVVSDKMQKTVVVAVESTKRHRLYKKILRRTKRYKAHDEHNECRLGDQVRIVETRPLSKEKRWRVAEILVRGNVADVQPRAIGAEILEAGRGGRAQQEAAREPSPPEPRTDGHEADAEQDGGEVEA